MSRPPSSHASRPAPAGAGVTEAAVLHVRSLVVRLCLANREFREAERKLDEICAGLRKQAPGVKDAKPRDGTILASLPGIGRSTLAPLLTEAVGPLGRRDRAALRTLSGVAPATKRSGKTCIVVMRHAAQVRLRQAALHWARVAVLDAPKCHGRYEAVKVLGVACVLLRRQTLFGPEHGTPVMP